MTTQRQNKYTDIYALRGIRTCDLSIELAKTVDALERSATVIGILRFLFAVYTEYADTIAVPTPGCITLQR
jgi:hypothetical protein